MTKTPHRNPRNDLTAWLDRHGYRHSHARKQKVPHPYATKTGTSNVADDSAFARAREISERRIAALIANGEDAHNTPAWRDAMHESQMIGLMSRMHAAPVVSSSPRAKHTRVELRWYAIPNQNKRASGFLPMIEEDGKMRGDTWASRGYDKVQAETMAEEQAHEAASRFSGDWNIIVKKGRPSQQKPQHAKIAKDMSWGPVKTSEQPPVGGATMSIDGRTFSIRPAAIRTVRDHYEHSLARLAKRNQDDAWLVISPNGSVLALITGLGRHWSIYRRGDGQPWRKDEEAEITYRRGVEDDWRTVVQGIVKMTI